MNRVMERVQVELGPRSYGVYIGDGLLDMPELSGVLADFVSDRKVLLVCDSNTAPLYGGRAEQTLTRAGASVIRHVIPSGEEHKTFRTAEEICRAAAQAGLDRGSCFFGLGGGVVTDLTGFAASIFMRGIPFISCPSTLLAMIDAGIGGKTGADLPEGKNLIGTFWQPRAVLADVSMLRTLPPEQLRCGCAELVKHAILFDPELFRELEEHVSGLLTNSDPARAVRLITRSSEWKASVVSGDEREAGRRALLNFGHSFGHAIEKLYEYRMGHGDAVAIGMVMASALAERLGILRKEDALRIGRLLQTCGLPRRVSGLRPEDILHAMRGDKKNIGGHTRLILPHRIGEAQIHKDTPDDLLLKVIGDFCD